MGTNSMGTSAPFFRWFYRTTILLFGIFLALVLSAGAAFATETTLPLTTTITGYDVTPPLFTRVAATEDASPDSATVEAEFLDVDSEIDTESDTVTVSDAFVSGCSKSNRKISCKASGMRSGDHSMRVCVKDRYGNRSERDHHFTVRDTVAPVIDGVIASPAGIQVKYHDPSPSSGIASVEVFLDGEKLNCDSSGSGCNDSNDDHDDHDGYDEDHDGYDHDNSSYDEDHDGYDDDHDGSDSDHDSFYTDSASFRHKSDGYFHDSDDDHDGSGSTGYSCPIIGSLTCGDHEVRVVVTDKAGNSSTSVTTVNSGADCTPPATTDNAPAGWQNTDVNVTLACTDTGSGCASTSYEVDGGATQTGNTVSLTAEGIHTITYRSVDVAGNVEATKTATVMIDKTPPDVTTSGDVTVEATGPAGAAVDFTSGATDALSGAGPVSCTAASGDTFPLGDATTVTCSSTDGAGNTGSTSFTVKVVDTTGPVVTYGGPNGTVVTNDSPTVTGTATDDVGVVSASVSIDGGAASACILDGLGNLSCATTGLAFGYHVAVITATDAAGNTGTATGYFCKSSGAPYLTVVCPTYPSPDFQWNSVTRVMTITYTLSDEISPGAYNVKIMASSGSSNAGPLVCLTPLPVLVGDVLPGSPVRVALAYQFPAGRVTSFNASVTACADDQCGNTYYEAPPGIPTI